MANLFERPIAANPMSEFVGLPLDFIQRTMDTRQKKYDMAKADIAAQEESLLRLGFLPGDRERHMDIQQGYEDRMDAMVENAGGDYGSIQASLDVLKREMKREIAYGELAAQQRNYTSAMGDAKILGERELKGTASQGGMALFNKSLQDHKTTPTDSGGFSTFSGYIPATEMDPLKKIHETVNHVVAQYDTDGTKGVDKDRVMTAIDNLRQTNPNIDKALLENFRTTPQDPNNPVTASQYLNSVIAGVVDAKVYQEQIKSKDANGNYADMVLSNVQRPAGSNGSMNMVGNSNIWFKKMLGITSEADEFIASKEGQRMKRALELTTGEKMPSDPVDRAAYIKRAMAKTFTTNINISGDTSKIRGVVSPAGQLLNPRAKRVDMAGNPVSIDQVMKGTEKGMKPVVKGYVTNGDYMGWVSIATPGGTFLEEPTSTEMLESSAYQRNQLDLVKRSMTYEKEVNLHGNKDFPAGKFNAIYNPDTGKTSLYRGGEERYRYWTDVDGNINLGEVKRKTE